MIRIDSNAWFEWIRVNGSNAKLMYDLPRPESLFDIEYFREKPEAFYAFAEDFLDMGKYEPTPTHHFIKMLQDKGIL